MTSRARFERLESLFHQAVSPTETRSRFDTTIEYDPELEARARALARADRLAASAVGAALSEGLCELDSLHGLPVVGDVVGGFHIACLLNTSGMSRVYRAVRPSDGRVAAIKVPAWTLPAHARHAIVDSERRTLARLDHPGVVRLVDGGGAGCEAPCLILELLDGTTLAPMARASSLRATLERCTELTDILVHVHERGVIHGDLKPGNLLLTSAGHLKLLDFGSATDVGRPSTPPSSRRTRGGSFTPAYASPEQVRGHGVTPLTDVYGVGAVLYELLTGRPPHADRQDLAAMLRATCESAPVPPSRASDLAFRDAISPALDAVVRRALHKDPAGRYRSMRALGAALRRTMSPWAGEPAIHATR